MPKSARSGSRERVMGVLGSMEPVLSAARSRSPQSIDASVEGALPHNSPPQPSEGQWARMEGSSARGGKGPHFKDDGPRVPVLGIIGVFPAPPTAGGSPDPIGPGWFVRATTGRPRGSPGAASTADMPTTSLPPLGHLTTPGTMLRILATHAFASSSPAAAGPPSWK